MIELIIARGLTENSHCRLCKEQQESATSFGSMQNVSKQSISGETKQSACGDGC